MDKSRGGETKIGLEAIFYILEWREPKYLTRYDSLALNFSPFVTPVASILVLLLRPWEGSSE